MTNIEFQVYDASAKRCVAALAQWFYDRAETGVTAVVGRELSQELINLFGKNRRLCDLLFDLLDVVLDGRPAVGAVLYDIQTRARGDELRRNAGYAGRILESGRFDKLEYFVHFLLLLTEAPTNFRTLVRGFPNDFRLFVIDLTKIDGMELLKVGMPEAAVLATLSVVAPRNPLIAGIVQILVALPTIDE